MAESSRLLPGVALGVTASIGLAISPRAQQLDDLFFVPRLEHTGAEGRFGAGAAADFDGDGDIDIVSQFEGQTAIFANDGFGRFRADRTGLVPEVPGGWTTRLATDVDGDGDVDIVLCGSGARSLINDGLGRFAIGPASTGFLGSGMDTVRTADFDGNGFPDLVFRTGQVLRISLNDGTGAFAYDASAFGPAEQFGESLEVGDVDGDGDVDILSARPWEAPKLHLNDGTGSFSQQTLLPLPGGAIEIRLGDIDGDSDPDLVLARKTTLISPVIVDLWTNDGSGTFQAATTFTGPGGAVFQEPFAGSIGITDLDGDGSTDVFIGSMLMAQLQTAPGSFTPVDSPGTAAGSWFELLDFDGDGDADFTTGTNSTSAALGYWANDGDGNFVAGAGPTLAQFVTADAFGDLDGDGILDLALGGFGTGVARNDGYGRFTTEPLGPLQFKWDSLLIDVTGDGALDYIAVGGRSHVPEQPQIFVNDGFGGLTDETATRFPVGTSYTRTVVDGDFTGDGIVDLFLAGTPSQLFVGSPSGTFTAQTGLPRDTAWADASDVDADGDLDLVVHDDIYTGPVTAVWFNDGAGNFTESLAAVSQPFGQGLALRLFDADGDGDDDMLLTTHAEQGIWRNDGTGRFVKRPGSVPSGATRIRDVNLGDVDEDGDIDLVLSTETYEGAFAGTTYEIWIATNDGAGVFGIAAVRPGSNAILGDIDGDLDLDLLPGVEANRLRQVHARYILRAGAPAEWAVHIHGGGFTQLFLSDAIAATPLATPFGPFRLAGSILPFGPVVPTTVGDVASIKTVLPDVPQILGVTIGVQAATATADLSRLSFTNLARPQTVIR